MNNNVVTADMDDNINVRDQKHAGIWLVVVLIIFFAFLVELGLAHAPHQKSGPQEQPVQNASSNAPENGVPAPELSVREPEGSVERPGTIGEPQHFLSGHGNTPVASPADAVVAPLNAPAAPAAAPANSAAVVPSNAAAPKAASPAAQAPANGPGVAPVVNNPTTTAAPQNTGKSGSAPAPSDAMPTGKNDKNDMEPGSTAGGGKAPSTKP